MLYVRTVKTASKSIAVQVIYYRGRKQVVVKHIGSTKSIEVLDSLKHIAYKWIDRETKQQRLFPSDRKSSDRHVRIDKLRNLGFSYTFAYETINKIFQLLEFTDLKCQILLDFVLMRIIQPASKLESLELLSEQFGMEHERTELYRSIPTIVSKKGTVEEKVIAFAKKYFSFDFSIVFYDVTTLYFETFKQDEDKGEVKGLRKNGFSKDNKSNQPQIVIGLIVTREGFPVAYDIFEGNTFEGKTFIPTILKFKKTHSINNLIVVADAAMISLSNVHSLVDNNLSYIVGARMGNLKLEQIKEISNNLGSVDEKSMRIETERGLLVCDFSPKRYKKDKHEMEKQIKKATNLISNPSKIKRSKFVKSTGDTGYALNKELIEKTTLLLGIRGYYTNLSNQTDQTIIAHYHNLWHVEQAFRVAKSDLAMRPIYHFKRQAIEAHILICFMALAVCKHMELQTGKSTKAIIKLFKGVTDAKLLNTQTNEEFIIRSEFSPEMQELLKKLSLHH